MIWSLTQWWMNLIVAAVAEEASLMWLNLQMFGDSPDLQRPTSYSRWKQMMYHVIGLLSYCGWRGGGGGGGGGEGGAGLLTSSVILKANGYNPVNNQFPRRGTDREPVRSLISESHWAVPTSAAASVLV